MTKPNIEAIFASLRGTRFQLPGNTLRELVRGQLDTLEAYIAELEEENTRSRGSASQLKCICNDPSIAPYVGCPVHGHSTHRGPVSAQSINALDRNTGPFPPLENASRP